MMPPVISVQPSDPQPAPFTAKKIVQARSDKVISQTIWLVTCETRNETQDLLDWKFTANHFKDMTDRSSQPIRVEATNICQGQEWKGFLTKYKRMTQFLTDLITQSGKDTSNIVMFTDSDSIFNAWAVTAEQLLERFHRARQGRNILVSAEPSCWVGRLCTKGDMAALYPDSLRSSCPQFLNSGQYMGDAKSMLTMLNEIMTMKKKHVVGPPPDDQARFATWQARNQDKAMLDTQASIFRSMVFGSVSSTMKPQKRVWGKHHSCGMDAINKCGVFEPPYSGSVNPSSLHIQMDPVPECETEVNPFSIHGNGADKSLYLNIARRLRCYYDPKSCQEIH